jgi:hypothetical protein
VKTLANSVGENPSSMGRGAAGSVARALAPVVALSALAAAGPASADPDDSAATIGQIKQMNVEDLVDVEVTSTAPDSAREEIQRAQFGKLAWRL